MDSSGGTRLTPPLNSACKRLTAFHKVICSRGKCEQIKWCIGVLQQQAMSSFISIRSCHYLLFWAHVVFVLHIWYALAVCTSAAGTVAPQTRDTSSTESASEPDTELELTARVTPIKLRLRQRVPLVILHSWWICLYTSACLVTLPS